MIVNQPHLHHTALLIRQSTAGDLTEPTQKPVLTPDVTSFPVRRGPLGLERYLIAFNVFCNGYTVYFSGKDSLEQVATFEMAHHIYDPVGRVKSAALQ